ncbi:MAG: leucine-rich repeat domain-containing protein [Planctomycetaceae bacterium]|nr:leucine-rich repeat domain-containing protein [Planctomycetaceae bacterium]
MRKLKYLNLSSTAIDDLSPLTNLQQLRQLELEYLNLSNTEISDISPLRDLPRLKCLNLADCTGVTDLTPLAELSEIEELNLYNLSIDDWTPLADMKKLRSLNLRATNVSDLTPLNNLAHLRYLSLDNTDNIGQAEVEALLLALPRASVSLTVYLGDNNRSDKTYFGKQYGAGGGGGMGGMGGSFLGSLDQLSRNLSRNRPAYQGFNDMGGGVF